MSEKTINKIALFNRRESFLRKQGSQNLDNALCFVKDSEDWNKIVVESSENSVRLPLQWKECYVLRFDERQPLHFVAYFINVHSSKGEYQNGTLNRDGTLELNAHKKTFVYWR